MDYQTVLSEVESWTVDERVRLVQDVWDRLADQGHEPQLTPEMQAELERRIDEMDRNPASGVPWEIAKARILSRFPR